MKGESFIPTVGPELVTGLTLEQAQKAIKKQMAQSFKGLVSTPPNVWLDVTIARLRPEVHFYHGRSE